MTRSLIPLLAVLALGTLSAQQRLRTLNTEGHPSKGSDDAPIVIVEFTDYQ